MEISVLGLIVIALCSLLFACSWVPHLDHLQNICVSIWRKIITKIFARNSGSIALPLPPGSFGLPWVGETVQFNNALQAGDLLHFLRQRSARFGSKTFKTHIFLKPTTVVQGAVANRFIAASENQNLLVNSWGSSSLRIVGQHVPVAKHGAEHRRLRHIITSCLCPAALQKLVGKADLLTRDHFATCWKGDSQLCLVPLLKLHTFRIACGLLASIEDEAVVTRLYPLFNTWIAGLVALPLNLPGTTFGKSLKARKVLLREVGDIIDRRRQDLAHLELSSSSTADDESHGVASSEHGIQSANSKSNDLLSMLIKAQDANGDSLNRDELLDMLLFILFAGHDTTTSTLAMALKFLEQNPDCVECLVQGQSNHQALSFIKVFYLHVILNLLAFLYPAGRPYPVYDDIVIFCRRDVAYLVFGGRPGSRGEPHLARYA